MNSCTRAAARLLASAALVAACSHSAFAQTMRFTTTVGSFDMVLNPTNNPNLQPLVDNIVAYIGLGRYSFTAVNRAADGDPGTDDDFVLQMGGFLGFPPLPELWATMNTPVRALTPVTVDANGDGEPDFGTLSNQRGRVSLALQAGNPNSGTSSFFINLGNNDFLDDQGFVPFAEIREMSTVDRIMALMQTDLSDEAGQPGNLALVDVPLMENGRMVIVTGVHVLEADPNFSFVGPIATALQLQRARSGDAAAAQAALLDNNPGASGDGNVPEPATAVMGLACVFAALAARSWRRR